MRRIERGDPPAFVATDEFARLKQEYESFQAGGGTRATQTKLDPSSSLYEVERLAMDHLLEVFDSTCAYTEVRTKDVFFHLHRPAADAYDETLGSSAEHYWWTATWWRNWYLATGEIVSLKRTNFPVIDGRAVPPQPDGQFDPAEFLDRGALLDPCEDWPEWHLRFRDNGEVEPWAGSTTNWVPPIDEARRGDETIRLLDLNAKHLVEMRSQAIRNAIGDDGLPEDIPPDERLAPDGHLGAIRQVIAERLVEQIDQVPIDLVERFVPEIAPHVAADPGRFDLPVFDLVYPYVDTLETNLAARVRRALGSASVAMPDDAGEAAAPSEPTRGLRREPADPPAVIPRTAAIQSVEIRNFKIIDEVKIEIPVEEAEIDLLDSGTPQRVRRWKTLLGENGSGKSSVLQAIGLALAGDELQALVDATGIEWRRMYRRGADEQGRVVIEFTGGARVDLRFDADGFEFVGPVPRMEGYVRGFGATRLIGPDDRQATDNVRLENLYNPQLPVVDAEQWLVDLDRDSPGDFNVVGTAIADLLDRAGEVLAGKAPGGRFVERVDDSITVGGDPLRDLSDGYRSVIAMACDLMAGAGTGLSDMQNATGIVLIDEIGAHLHPKWKMGITKKLRRVFPSMQFLISTHEPLCLLGLVEGEVVRVRNVVDEHGVRRATFEEIDQSPTNFRVDRLLTSEFFGLHSTIDPAVDRVFQEYYALLALPDGDPRRDEDKLRDLRAKMSRHGVLGYTRRDQLVYEAIDQFLAREDGLTDEQRRAERAATLSKVHDIWENVATVRAARGGP